MMLAFGLALMAAVATGPLWTEKLNKRNNGWSIAMPVLYGKYLWCIAVIAGECILAGEISRNWMAIVTIAVLFSLAYLHRK